MSAGKISVLLLLAVIGSHAAPNPSKCEGLTKRLQTKDLNKIFRNWVLVWSVADHEEGDSLVSNISSSHVEFQLLPENKTISYIERNVYNQNLSSCTTYFMNVTAPSNNETEIQTLRVDNIRLEVDGQPVEYNDTGAVDFYETCPDCLMLVYKTSSGRYLLDYKEEGSHRDVEKHKAGHDDHKKLADCLGFPDKKAYVYDGVADFCHRKSAPEGNPEQS
ncbi:saxitoxin and tetrodotoxin-binding protein 2 [Oryzias melastigma]|uniref:Saxitoxin and tetrodotoxin-binding protein 2-like n=1 Tax=Oryzias melastigma TaxID=30732 RepID=A0A3B3BUH9_ORYME|nr:saxitoxin and tetrodotoxin-binding protein 2 [Oryzias melastigma]